MSNLDLFKDILYTVADIDNDSFVANSEEAKELLAEEGKYWRQEAFNRYDRDTAIYEDDVKNYRTRENKIKSLTSNYAGDVDTLASELALLDGYDLTSSNLKVSTRNNIINNYKAKFIGFDSNGKKVDNINNAVRVEFTDSVPEPIEPLLSSYYDAEAMSRATEDLDIRGDITNKIKGRTNNTDEVLGKIQEEFTEKTKLKTMDYKNFFNDPETRSVNVSPIESKLISEVTAEDLELRQEFLESANATSSYEKWQQEFQGIVNMDSTDYNAYASLMQNILQLSPDEVSKLFETETVQGKKQRTGLTIEGRKFFNSIAPVLDEVYKGADFAFTKNPTYDTFNQYIDRDYVINMTTDIAKARTIKFNTDAYFSSEQINAYIIPNSIVSTSEIVDMSQKGILEEFKTQVEKVTIEKYEELKNVTGNVTDEERKNFANVTFTNIVSSVANDFITKESEIITEEPDINNQEVVTPISPTIQDGKLIGGDLPLVDGKPGSIDLESLKDPKNLEELKSKYPLTYEYYINNIPQLNKGGLLDEQDFLNNFKTNFSD